MGVGATCSTSPFLEDSSPKEARQAGGSSVTQWQRKQQWPITEDTDAQISSNLRVPSLHKCNEMYLVSKLAYLKLIQELQQYWLWPKKGPHQLYFWKRGSQWDKRHLSMLQWDPSLLCWLQNASSSRNIKINLFKVTFHIPRSPPLRAALPLLFHQNRLKKCRRPL